MFDHLLEHRVNSQQRQYKLCISLIYSIYSAVIVTGWRLNEFPDFPEFII